MRSHTTRTATLLTLVIAVFGAAGCGDDDNTSSDTTRSAETAADPAADGAYCDAAVEWAIHELTPSDENDPAALRTYWEEWTAFQKAAVDTAPEEIKADWVLKFETESEIVTPVFEKYDYAVAAIMASGTPEEQAVFEAPEDVQAAQVRILDYESRVCGAQQPVAADVSFDGEEAGPYCGVVAEQNKAAGEALASGDPEKIEAAADEFEGGAKELIEVAPDAIKDDVTDLTAWVAGEQRAVFEAFDYDIAEALRRGTPEQRLDLNYAAQGIRDQFARILAYEEQVCGAE